SGTAVVGPVTRRGTLCEDLLRGLPDWFGIEASIVEYRRTVEELPSFVAEVDGEPAGLLALKPTAPAAVSSPAPARAGVAPPAVRAAAP
ncbi:MAG: hypothetical protein V2J16_12285, partial [Thermoleophilia bacterium]|nr:hypothetical protein [Thermoleophilia bacterium]